jgi:hypothetical protein
MWSDLSLSTVGSSTHTYHAAVKQHFVTYNCTEFRKNMPSCVLDESEFLYICSVSEVADITLEAFFDYINLEL